MRDTETYLLLSVVPLAARKEAEAETFYPTVHHILFRRIARYGLAETRKHYIYCADRVAYG